MFDDDDDDGVEPQFKAVDEYHFEVSEDEPACFSILPFQFDENDKVEDCHSEKKVYLRGHREMDKSHLVHKKVVAWRVGLDCEQPNISVLSSEGNWIKLLNPWKPYKDEIARSILITVQMIHFVRKQHIDKRSLWGRLWHHLNEVFDKLDTKPDMDDLRKHHPLIKLFLERDPALMKLKILHRFIGDTTKTTKKTRTLGTQAQLADSDESHGRNNYTDSDYEEDVDNDNSDDDDNNDSDYDDDNDKYSEDDNSDVDTNNDDATDELCALCDDGGNLLSCIGPCKRSFHPRKKDGRESECKTLGYTSAQLKEIGVYLCKNCKYKQHQCFKCGELEPSAEPHAKVFKCKNPSCGHFYHPKCVAKLLEPDDPDSDGSCELAQRIMEGLRFTCPVHWCFKCRRMEDRTKRAMQLAACRRCPKSYHIECLPREISFETKDKNIKQRAWKLSGIVIIYCLDHEICEASGNAKRDHIKFPQTTKNIKIRDLSEKKGNMASKRKRSISQCSANKNQRSSLPYAVGSKMEKRKTSRSKKEISSRTPCNIPKNCVDHSVQVADKLHLRLEPSGMGNLLENPSVDKDMDLDMICKIPEDKDGIGKEKSSEHSGEENATNKDTSHENNEQNDVADTSHENNSRCNVNSEAMGIHTSGRKSRKRRRLKKKETDGNNVDLDKNKRCDQGDGKEAHCDIQAEVDLSKLKSRAETSMELAENANRYDSIPGQEKEIPMGENQMHQSTCEQESGSYNGKLASNESTKSGSVNGVIPDHVDDNPAEKLMHAPHVNKMTIIDRIHTQPEYDCDENREVNGGHTFQDKPINSQCNVNPEAVDMHASGRKTIKRRRLKKKSTDGNNADLDKNKRCDQGDGKEAHCDIQAQVDESKLKPRSETSTELAEVDQSKLKSRVETSMELGGNANGHDSVPGQGKEISMGENQLRRSTYEQESRSYNGKIARKESTKSGSGNGVTLDHVDNNPAEKLMHAHVDKMTITDRIHTQPTYDCDEDREVNGGHTFHGEPVNSQCNVNPEAVDIHTSGGKTRKRRLRKNATNGNNADLDKNKRCDQGDGNEAHCDDSTYQCPPNNKEPDYQEHKFENSGLHGPRCTDENRAAEVSEYRSRQSAGPSRRENLTHDTQGNLSNTPMGRNSRKEQRKHSSNWQSTYRDGCKPCPPTNYRLMYEQWLHVNCPSSGNSGLSHVTLQPVLPPAYSDANRLHNPCSYPRGLEHGTTGWRSPHIRLGNPERFTHGLHCPPYYLARPQHVNYAQNANSLPIHGHDERGNFLYGGYHARGNDPAALQHNNGTYQPHTDVSMEGRGAAYGGPNREYRVRSNYTLGLGPRPPAARSVTNSYAPHLEFTNNWPRL